ncbi:hook-length control protein FliK [Gracilibacillus orientalis]|uniref:Hook-length control protein FliK n=1 Tax=Gracilibacillus orientalis TaxID=334253 RepID=A0A1I4PX74_9BACI|nr:flagellar hook-length control protein FliK [Gracilibacillus orientalis]SFM32216.1 hook-length control protein FliK [Gracilibacillus orientalis]
MMIASEWLTNGSAIPSPKAIRDKARGNAFSDLMSSNMISYNQEANVADSDSTLNLVKLTDKALIQESLDNLSAEQLNGITEIIDMINNKLETDGQTLSTEEIMTFISEDLNEEQIEVLGGLLEAEDQEVLAELIKKFLEQIESIGQSQQEKVSMEQPYRLSFSDGILVQNNFSTEAVLDKNAISRVEQTEKILQQIQNQTLSSRDYKQMLQLLKQWSQMSNQTLNAAQKLLSEATNDKSSEIWSKLLSNFNNRQSMQQHYGSIQKVTQQDVKRWSDNAMERLEPVMKQDQAHIVRNDTGNQQVQSKIQQYVIHLSHTNSDQPLVQKQLIDQFQQVMQKSNFMKLPNGANQLMIRLQPEHLGDITVKLTQINGEMTVKMIASTHGAKELLEGNLNQLRHMFSPQQVIIEKQENSSQVSQEELTDDNLNSQEEEQQEQHNDHEEESNQDNQNQSFHDMLMDAKV